MEAKANSPSQLNSSVASAASTLDDADEDLADIVVEQKKARIGSPNKQNDSDNPS